MVSGQGKVIYALICMRNKRKTLASWDREREREGVRRSHTETQCMLIKLEKLPGL